MATITRPPVRPPAAAPAPSVRPPRVVDRQRPHRPQPQRVRRQAPPRPRQRRVAGEQPAGQILVAMVVALGLAALVNADAMVERAEQRPLGAARDRALALWHPVQDVSHVLQLHRLRDLADVLSGGDDRPRSDTVSGTVSAPPDGAATTVPPVRPQLRTPTPAAPLRMWVGGDSMMQVFGESLVRLAGDTGIIDPTLHYEISSGLTRPDYYDWPAALAADMAEHDPDVVVIMFGANDGQGIVEADGTVHQRVAEPGWQREYARRVGAVMDQLRAPGRLVVWVGQPVMGDGDFDRRMAIVDRIYAAEAARRPWVDYLDTRPLLPSGSDPELRQGDGIHLTREGGDLLGAAVLDLLAPELE